MQFARTISGDALLWLLNSTRKIHNSKESLTDEQQGRKKQVQIIFCSMLLKTRNSKSGKPNKCYVTYTSFSTQIFLCRDQSSRWHSLEQYSSLQMMQNLSPVKPQHCKIVQSSMRTMIPSKLIKKSSDTIGSSHIFIHRGFQANILYGRENQDRMDDSGADKSTALKNFRSVQKSARELTRTRLQL